VNPLHWASDIRNPKLFNDIPAVGIGPLAGDLTQAGGHDEWVDVEDYIRAIRICAKVIVDWRITGCLIAIYSAVVVVWGVRLLIIGLAQTSPAMQAAGVRISAPDREPFRAAARSVYEDWAHRVGGMDRIEAILGQVNPPR